MRSKFHLLLATSLLASGAAGAQTRAPTANEAIEQARRNARASEQEAARNLDEGVKGKRKPSQVKGSLQERYVVAIKSGDSTAIAEILKEMQKERGVDDDFASDGPGELQVVSGPGFAGVVSVPASKKKTAKTPVTPAAKAPVTPASKAPGPKKAPPKKEEDVVDRQTTEELKRDLDASRRALDAALRRRDEARIPRDTISERDRQQQIRETNEESQRLYEQVKDADARYRRRLQQENPAEYERYDREQRDITRRNYERGPMDMRDAMQPPSGNGKLPDRPGLQLQEYNGPNGQGPGAQPPKKAPAAREPAPRDYDGPQGQESERRLEGGQNAYEADRVVAPGLNKGPDGKAPPRPLRDYEGPQGTNPGDRLSGGADGGDGPVLAPGLGNTPPPSGPKR